jgi:molybdopterin synthase sulfur carrier subunit
VTKVTVRYFAAARAATGLHEEIVDASSVDEVLTALCYRYDSRFAAVLSASSLLLDGVQAHDLFAPLTDDVVLDVLPPFAGG